MRTTMDAIKEHKKAILKEYAEDQLLGVFLYGSQNYGIATENSDVDTKAIIIPSIEDLCLKKPVSREIKFDNEEHCEIKDIREMIKMFKKQNINFIEILYTDYCLINPKYNRIWREYFINKREYISHISKRQTVMSICGQAIHTLNQNKTDGKKYANGLRLYHFLISYLSDSSYKYCINIELQEKGLSEKLIAYKQNKICVDEEDTNKLIKKFLWLESIAESYDKELDKNALKILDKGLLALITNEHNNFDFYSNF
jgi:predicted nucleotidyltransferase